MENFIVLVVALVLIAVLWNIITPREPERVKETRIVSIGLVVFGLLCYIVQTAFLG